MYNIWIMNHHATTKCRHTYLAKELSKKGHAVKLFASSFKHNDYIETQEYPANENYFTEKEDGYQRVWIKTPAYKGNGVKRLINQIAFSRRSYKAGLSLEKPDIIIGSSVHLFTGLSAYKLSKKFNVPFIFEVRDLWPQTLVDLGVLSNKNPITIFFSHLEKFLYKRADKIISVLPKGDKYIASLDIDKNKIIHLPNGVDLSWFDKNYNKKFNDKKLSNYFDSVNGMIASYTGAHGKANGLKTLVEAAKILKERKIDNVKLLLVGSGPKKDELIALSQKYNLKNITFLPRVDKDEVPKILNHSDFCISIVKESEVHKYGVSMNKLFDYMASGKPMISALKAAFDFADVANCGIAIPPEDPKILADAIIEMSKMSEQKRKELGQNGRKYVAENHDYPVLADKLLKVINDILR